MGVDPKIFRRVCMEFSKHNWATISETICSEMLRAGFATAKGDLRLGWISKTKTVITNLWEIPSFAPETINNSAVAQTNCVDFLVQPGTFISSQEVRQNSLCQSGWGLPNLYPIWLVLSKIRRLCLLGTFTTEGFITVTGNNFCRHPSWLVNASSQRLLPPRLWWLKRRLIVCSRFFILYRD